MLQIPGIIPAYLASIVGRLPAGALGLLLILRTRELTGSFAAGGAVAGVYALANGISAPLLGRAVDRRGQGPVLIVSAVAGAVALAAFAALPDGSSAGTAGVLAAAMGVATPPLSGCQRALWAALTDPALRHRAFAIDAVIFELVYIAGPLVLVGVIGSASLPAAIGACSAFTALGSIAFARTALSRDWRPAARDGRDPLGPLRGPGVRTLVAAAALLALGLGGMEIGLTAFATEQGSPGAVGALLALWGAGSLAGGLLAARARAPAEPARRLAALMLGLALLELPLLLAGDLVAMALLITVAGIGVAPALSQVFALVSEVSATGTVTEALTWISSAIAAGIAGGSAVGGWLVESAGTTEALALVVAYGVAAAAVVATRPSTLATA